MNLQDRLQLAPTFIDFLKQYDKEDLVTMSEHGCEGGIPDMIWYEDTTAIYNQYDDELHSIYEHTMECGSFAPEYIQDSLGSARTFKNAMVWYCAEVMSQTLVEHESEV